MSVQPAPWPQPSPQIAAAVGRMYRGRRAPLAVVIRDELGELYADVAFVAAFGVRGHPNTVLIDRAGKIVGRILGERDWSSPEAHQLVESLLRDGQ